VDEQRQSADVVVLMVDVVAGAHGRYPCCPPAAAHGGAGEVDRDRFAPASLAFRCPPVVPLGACSRPRSG
jgi:hypothetical protein